MLLPEEDSSVRQQCIPTHQSDGEGQQSPHPQSPLPCTQWLGIHSPPQWLVLLTRRSSDDPLAPA